MSKLFPVFFSFIWWKKLLYVLQRARSMCFATYFSA